MNVSITKSKGDKIMDSTSFSNAPQSYTIAAYENDDMSASIDRWPRFFKNGGWENGFQVYAGSYDGSLLVWEFFKTKEAAKALYGYILDSYTSSPPASKKEVRALINRAKRIDSRKSN